jgi:hypothetical protein
MSNPDDWRFTSPTPPHAPSHDRQTPGLPAPTGAPPSGGAEYSPTATGGGGGCGCGIALLVAIFFVPIFGCLYPLPAAAAVAAYYGVDALLRAGASLSDDYRLPLTLGAGAVAFWIASRLEFRLAARAPLYRAVRHVVRVLLIGGFITVAVMNDRGRDGVPTSIAKFEELFSNPRYLIVLVFWSVVAHLILTKATGFREKWGLWMEVFRLRRT